MLDLLLSRAKSRSKRNLRTDPYHIAFVVECGGMRNAAASGFIKVLSEHNLADSFDSFHGSSAGACAAAYFLTNQPDAGRSIFFEDICHRRVVSPYRFYSNPPMVDTDYICEEVIGKLRRLDFADIIKQPKVLNIVTSARSSGKPTVHNQFHSEQEIVSCLKATLRVPGLRETGIKLHDDYHLDGGIVAPIPIFSALESGATHVLVVGTQRSSDYFRKNNSVRIESSVLQLLYGGALANAYAAANTFSGQELWQAKKTRTKNLDVLARPETSKDCSWHTIDLDTLRNVERECEIVTRSYLSGKAASLTIPDALAF